MHVIVDKHRVLDAAFTKRPFKYRQWRTNKGYISFVLEDLLLAIIISFLSRSLDRTKYLFFV